jgi:hypothetical protein
VPARHLKPSSSPPLFVAAARANAYPACALVRSHRPRKGRESVASAMISAGRRTEWGLVEKRPLAGSARTFQPVAREPHLPEPAQLTGREFDGSLPPSKPKEAEMTRAGGTNCVGSGGLAEVVVR